MVVVTEEEKAWPIDKDLLTKNSANPMAYKVINHSTNETYSFKLEDEARKKIKALLSENSDYNIELICLRPNYMLNKVFEIPLTF